MISRIPCTVCRTTVSTPINFLLRCSCGISLHHKCVVPAIPQKVLMSMIEASTNDRHANSLQTWQCPSCKAHEVSLNDKKILQSRFRTFASSSNLQIEEAYRRMQLKRPIESIYDHPPLIPAACINKKPKGAHTRVKAAAKDTGELKYVATSGNSGPPSTDLQPVIYKTSPRSKRNRNKPLSVECSEVANTNCRRTVKSSPKLLFVTNKLETKSISDSPSMNVATNVQSQLDIQGSTFTNSHEAQHPAVTNQTTCLNQDKAKEAPLPPLLDLRKYLNTKNFPKRRHNTFRPTFSDQGAPPAKRRRLVYRATVPDVHTAVEGPKNDDATPLLPDANDNNDLIPIPSPSLSRPLKARDNPIVTSRDKDTAQATSISSHAPSEQQQSVVELVESSTLTHTITTQSLYPSPTPTCPTAIVPSPAITPIILPSSLSPTKLSKAGHLQDNPELYVQSDSAEQGCASLENDIAESSNGNPSTTNGQISQSPVLLSSNNSAINQECLMEDLALNLSSGIHTAVEDDASEVNNQLECAVPDLTEPAPDNSKMIDGHSVAAYSIPEADQVEVEALDTPIPIPGTANCEIDRKDIHVEPSFVGGLFSPPPTDDETQSANLGPPSITHIEDIPHGLAANIRHVNEVTPVGRTELVSSLDNILKRLPQPPPSFRLSTVTVPGLAKCFRPFGLSTKRAH